MFCLLGLGCCGSFSPCLNPCNFYPEWRWNFLAKEYIRAQISSYFQKHVVSTVGSEIGKLKNRTLAKYSVSFTFLFSIQSQYTSAGFPVAVIHIHLSCSCCVFISSFLLSRCRHCPPPVFVLASHIVCRQPPFVCGCFPEQVRRRYWESSRPEKSGAAEDSSPSSCLPWAPWTRCPPSALRLPFCTHLWAVPSHCLFLLGQGQCFLCCRASTSWIMILTKRSPCLSPSWLQRQSEVLSLILQ